MSKTRPSEVDAMRAEIDRLARLALTDAEEAEDE